MGFIRPSGLSNYLDGFVSEAHSEIADEGPLKLGALLNLLCHKNPGLRILELGNTINEITEATLNLLHANSALIRLNSYTLGSFQKLAICFEDGGHQKPPQLAGQSFDLVLLPFESTAEIYLGNHIASIRTVMDPNEQGETALIHSGAGGVGSAAIQIAQLAGTEVGINCSSGFR